MQKLFSLLFAVVIAASVTINLDTYEGSEIYAKKSVTNILHSNRRKNFFWSVQFTKKEYINLEDLN